LVGGHLGQCRGKRGLAVVDVTDGPDVDVRFAAIEFFFCHVVCASLLRCRRLSRFHRRLQASVDKSARPSRKGWLASRSPPSLARNHRASFGARRLEPMSRIELRPRPYQGRALPTELHRPWYFRL